MTRQVFHARAGGVRGTGFGGGYVAAQAAPFQRFIVAATHAEPVQRLSGFATHAAPVQYLSFAPPPAAGISS